MKKLFLVANWKSNKTIDQAHSFIISFLNQDFIHWLHTHANNDKTLRKIIICPPSFLLPYLSQSLKNTPTKAYISLGAQDVSPFGQGPHTGEESAEQLAEFAKYVIIGHSERRREFGETDELVAKKVRAAREYQLEPIVCVQGKETRLPDNVHIIAYEPPNAIGTGKAALLEVVEEVANFFKQEKHVPYVLYGGSVTPENVHQYTSHPAIDGVLVGGASLDPIMFSEIVMRA